MVSLAERRRCVTYLRNEYGVSERRACQAMQMNRASYRYVGSREPVDEGYRRVVSLSREYPYWGYRKIYGLLRGVLPISRERVRLIRRREGLQVVRKRRKRRLLGTTTQWVHRACFPNHVWSYDFVFDQTEDGRQLKCLTVVDEFTRQGLGDPYRPEPDRRRCHPNPGRPVSAARPARLPVLRQWPGAGGQVSAEMVEGQAR